MTTALVIIDVQTAYCDPLRGRGNNATVRVADRIERLTPAFRAAAIPVFVVYTGISSARPPEFYKLTPAPSDVILRKSSDSAFDDCILLRELEKAGCQRVLLAGFNANACVKSSALDALGHGYKVDVLSDLIGNDNQNRGLIDNHLHDIRQAGGRVVHSETALWSLK